MKRRDLMVAAGSAAALAACAPKPQAGATRNSDQRFQWKMVTSWPPNFPGLGTSVVRLGEMLEKTSGGRLTIKVYGGNELVPPFEVFDAVSSRHRRNGPLRRRTTGKASPRRPPFFSAVPFGLNAQEMNGWLYHGGGLELWRELYAKFDLVPFAVRQYRRADGRMVQPGDSPRSSRPGKGLKMRIPGLGGEVMARLGVVHGEHPRRRNCSRPCSQVRDRRCGMGRARTTTSRSGCIAPRSIAITRAGRSRARPSSAWSTRRRTNRCRRI
jgi:TRAP-type mannitol/chloroaromatic compound transport system substrate-binding protein